jgi:hypothetical protein
VEGLLNSTSTLSGVPVLEFVVLDLSGDMAHASLRSLHRLAQAPDPKLVVRPVQRARELVNTPEFAKAQWQRKKAEALFAELKNQIGVRRLRLRRLSSFGSSSSGQRLHRISNE